MSDKSDEMQSKYLHSGGVGRVIVKDKQIQMRKRLRNMKIIPEAVVIYMLHRSYEQKARAI